MKLSHFFYLSLLLTFFACDDDDMTELPPADCAVADWVGTFTGTQQCDQEFFDVELSVVAAGADSLIIEYTKPGTLVELDPIAPQNCSLAKDVSALGVYRVEATLAGDEITFREIWSSTDGVTTDACTITATRD